MQKSYFQPIAAVRNVRRLSLLLIAAFFLHLQVNAQAASATWSLTANGNAAVSGAVTATVVTAGPGYRAGGISALSYGANGVSSTNWISYSYTTFDINSNYYNQDYYQYTVAPTAGNNLTVNSITLQVTASTSTPSWFVYYSLDNFATATAIGTVNATSLTGLAIPVPNGSTLRVRVFGMDLVSAGTAFRNRNVVISGTTSSACPTPGQPSSIAGAATSCSGSAQTYSVTNDPSATSYTWTLPGGWTGSSTTNSINLSAGSAGGTLSVTANNGCGSSAVQTVSLNVNDVPATPAAIGGTLSVCSGAGATYSVTNDPAATSYTWTLPGGWTGSSATGSISATAGTTGGTITVTANNSCGSSAQQTATLDVSTTAPATPAAITGAQNICGGTPQSYNVAADPAAASYTWALPAGWTGSSTANSIAANSGMTGGTISVTATNACGTSTAQTIAVTVSTAAPATPSAMSGNAFVCQGEPIVYMVNADPAATSYAWTLPNGWSGSSTGNSITAVSGNSGGSVSVIAANGCGMSAASILDVTVNPATSSTITQTSCDSYTLNGQTYAASGTYTQNLQNAAGCDSTLTLILTINTVNANATQNGNVLTATAAGATYSWIDCSSGNAVPGANGQTLTATGNGTYAVIVTQNGCSATSSCMTVTNVGIEELDVLQLTVFPNPGTGIFTVTLPEAGGTLTVRNELGQIVAVPVLFSGTEVTLDLTAAAAGIYYLDLNGSAATGRARIVKQ